MNASLSRLVAKAFIDNPHNKLEVDHIDRNPKNNRVDNLRWATRFENLANSIKDPNRKLPKGVFMHRTKFAAATWHLGRKKHLGHFLTCKEAKKAYDDFQRKKYGDFFLS